MGAQSGTKFMYMVSYDKLVKDKEFEINKLAKAMGITLSQAVSLRAQKRHRTAPL